MKSGDVIADRYELEEPIGRGGMAEVWRAVDERLRRPVAIKFLAREFSGDPETLVRFFAEAQSVARIQHPNVVTVLDFGELEGHPFLVMEHVAGGPLTAMIGNPIMPDRALEIVGAVAGGAGAAHELGIVHRDIKPGNILLDEDGNPKLADFGIASSHMADRLTASGVAIGSPHYISPEQAAGAPATTHSDVYSLGVVMYEMLTATKPFEGKSVTAIVLAHVEQPPEPPSQRIPGLDPRCDALVMRCLAKDPEERYEDGYGLQEAVRAVAEDSAPTLVEEAPAGWVEDSRGRPRPLRRRRLIAVAFLVLALGGLLTLNITSKEPAPASDPTPTEKSDEDPRRGSPAPNNEAGLPASDSKQTEPELEATPSESPTPAERPTEPAPSPSATPSESPSPDPTESPEAEVAPTDTARLARSSP